MSRTIKKVCNGKSREHADAMLIVDYLFSEGGASPLPHPDVAHAIGFTKRRGTVIEVDMGRYGRAINHVKDRIWRNNKPCCGYRLHYRGLKSGEPLALVDPTGDRGDHATAAAAQFVGWQARERQRHTENLRQVVTLETLGDDALAKADKTGFQLCQRAVVELEEFGTIKPVTMALLEDWIKSIL